MPQVLKVMSVHLVFWFINSINTICINRAELLFRPFNIHTDGTINVELAVNTMRKVSGHILFKVINTWLNGWTTSHRMHEDPILASLVAKTRKTVFLTL